MSTLFDPRPGPILYTVPGCEKKDMLAGQKSASSIRPLSRISNSFNRPCRRKAIDVKGDHYRGEMKPKKRRVV
jgi:hypothetical protein